MKRFRERFFRLAAHYPRLRRGGLTVSDLEDLARRIGRRFNIEVFVQRSDWPWPASIQRIAGALLIHVDARRLPAQQVLSLAHEVGHLALGHYQLDDFWTDCDGPQSREEEHAADLFAAIVLDRHRTPIQYLGGPEQLEIMNL